MEFGKAFDRIYLIAYLQNISFVLQYMLVFSWTVFLNNLITLLYETQNNQTHQDRNQSVDIYPHIFNQKTLLSNDLKKRAIFSLSKI